jgi:hypothetical protein
MRTIIASGLILLSLSAPAPVLAQGPSVSGVYPAGARAGTNIDVTVTGANLADVREVLVSGAGVKLEKAPGGNAGSCPLKVTVDPGAEIGLRELRIVTKAGASNAARFWVGRFPDLREKEPNDDRSQPQVLKDFPVTVQGRADKATDVDTYAFEAPAGETWVFSINAARHHSDLDGYLALYDPRGVIAAYAMDGFGRDPRLVYTFKESGRHLLRVRDSMYRGGPGYTYSVTVGRLPVVTRWSPMGGVRGRTVTLDLEGYNLDGMEPQRVALPADCPDERIRFVPRTALGPANPIDLFVDDVPEVVEYEPNEDVKSAGAAVLHPVPLLASGRVGSPGDRDVLRFELKEKQQVVIEVHARRIGSRLDPVLRLLDETGKELANNDDFGGTKDSRISFTAPKAGAYLAEVRSLSTRGGDDFFYRLEVRPPPPAGFRLTMTPDNPTAPPGAAVAVTVNAQRQGYNGEIALSLENLPEGVTASPAAIRAGQNSAVFTLAAAPGAEPASRPLRVIGSAKIGEATVREVAVGQEEYQPPLANAQQKRRRDTELMVASVGAEAPYTLSIVPEKLEVKAGDKLEVTVKAARKKDYKEAIAVTVLGLPGAIKATALTINGNQAEGKLTLTAAANTPVGPHPVVFQGNAKNVLVAVPTVTINAQPAPKKEEPAKK